MAVADGGLGASSRPHPLLLHQGLEAGVVHGQPLLGEQLLGQVVGKAVGVVQLEGVGGVDPRRALFLGLGDKLRQQGRAAVERAPERRLLVPHPPQDRLSLLRQLGIRVGHQLDHPLGEPVQEGRLELEHASLLDRAAHHPPQHVAALLVGGNDAVGDQEGHPPGVVRDDPHCPCGHAIVAVGAARELPGDVDQWPEDVGLEHRPHPLQNRRHPLQAHPGVDVVLGQRCQRAVIVQLVGHEDVVPVLEEPIRVVAGPIVGIAELEPAVEVHLRRGAAGPGQPSLPEILRARQRHDPLLGNPTLLPDLDRLLIGAQAELLVAAEHGHPDPLGIEAEDVEREL